jgi:competence protein ComEC
MFAYFKTEIPFLRLAIFFIAGISFSIIYNLKPHLIWFLPWALSFLLLLYFSANFKKKQLYLNTSLLGFLMYVLIFISGIIICNQRKEIYQSSHFSKHPSQQLIVYLTEEPKTKGDVARFMVEVKDNISNQKVIKTSGKLLLALRFDTTKSINLHYGDLLIIKSKYQETEPAYNPSEFNYKRYLSFQQIYHQSFINQKQVIKIGENEGNPIKAFALKFREKQVEKFNKYLIDKDAKAVAATLILGYRADLSQDILNAYSKTGTMHVLSVSGMHVAIVVILLSFILGFMDKNRNSRIFKAALMIGLIWFYSIITGLQPSVGRAAIMLTFILIAKARAKKVNIFNIIGLTAFILLIYNPFNITNVGFQLSFIAVAGLIYLQPKIYNLYQPQNKIIQFIWATIAVSIAAQLSTTPISLYYFHQFPLYFIISNLFITIPAAFIMYIGITFLLSSWFIPLIKILGLVLNELIDFTNKGLMRIEQLKFASIQQLWMNTFEIALFYIILTLFLMSVRKSSYLKYALIFLGIFIINLGYKEFNEIKQKQVTFFSLRKNTAVALIKGKNATLITDLDPNEFTYLFSVKPYLDSCNVSYIQFVNPHLTQDEKIYSFEGHQLKIINHKNNTFTPSKVDWLLLSGDKIYNMDNILKSNTTNELFVDGKNRDYVIKGMQQQLVHNKLRKHILKREFAVEIKL